MNALVQYDSSSDEDGSPPVLEPSAKAENRLELKIQSTPRPTDNGELITKQNAQLQGPLLGPSASADTFPSYASYEEGDDDKSAMSERDMIRYLTQPTYPMAGMPPSPPGSPDMATSTKFRRFLELKAKGVHFNEDLARKDAFKNPGLLTTMIARAGIDGMSQYITSLPAEVLDLSLLPGLAYKEELLKSQQSILAEIELKKKAQSAAGKRTIDFAPAATSGISSRTSTPEMHTKRKRL